MKKLIFLDIDGVLNVISTERDEFGAIFQEPFISNLKYIIDKTDAKIVISSTWRASGFDIMQEMWKKRNLPGEIYAITPSSTILIEDDDLPFEFYDEVFRGHEIDFFIKQECDTFPDEDFRYVIIDDDNDMLEIQRSCFVRTSNNWNDPEAVEGYGLTKSKAEEVIRILNQNEEK